MPYAARPSYRRSLTSALVAGMLGIGMLLGMSGQALADLRICNMTGSRVGVSLGYRDSKGWLTEGWWNLGVRDCQTLISGTLVARYYYIHAVDYDRGGEWAGRSLMCTREKEFSIRGIENCFARGYDRTGFFEVDTGQQKSWTIQLTEQNQQREEAQ
ncbi:DUF1036 domain-containing protein [Pseudochelatococcus sp. G4_1912]|uniref:DUF1036 domain-containing protein n=1 Tax=Pseudochelatococcus sp. G4_1912 TaxID=3114288 RepID=UPI0039C62558